jgi:hypothetical protein
MTPGSPGPLRLPEQGKSFFVHRGPNQLRVPQSLVDSPVAAMDLTQFRVRGAFDSLSCVFYWWLGKQINGWSAPVIVMGVL